MLKQLKEDIQAVFARDPAARNTLEVLTTYPVYTLYFCIGLHMNCGKKIAKVPPVLFRHLVVLQRVLKFTLELKSANASLSIMAWAL